MRLELKPSSSVSSVNSKQLQKLFSMGFAIKMSFCCVTLLKTGIRSVAKDTSNGNPLPMS